MKTFIYKAGDAAKHKELGKYLQELQQGDYLIVIKKNRVIRSLSANKFYHAIVNLIATHTGHTHQQIHEICKYKFNADIVHLPKGGVQVVGKTTSDMNTEEFAAYINRVKQWAIDEFDLILPEREDLGQKEFLDIENNYERVISGW